MTCSVPSRAMRCGQADAGDRSADRVGPGARDLREGACVGDADARSARADGAVEPLHRLSPPAGRHGEELRRRQRQRLGAGRGHERLAAAPRRSEQPAAVGVELGERVVEQQERRDAALGGEELGLGEEQREHGDPLLSLRAERAEVAVAGEQATSSRCGPRPVVPRSRSRASRASSASRDGGSPS